MISSIEVVGELSGFIRRGDRWAILFLLEERIDEIDDFVLFSFSQG